MFVFGLNQDDPNSQELLLLLRTYDEDDPRSCCSAKVQDFLWSLLKNKLNAADNLIEKRINFLSHPCTFCLNQLQTASFSTLPIYWGDTDRIGDAINVDGNDWG